MSEYGHKPDITIARGDALQALMAVPAESVDMVLTDPPYSSGAPHQAGRNKITSKKYQNSDAKRVYPEFLGDNRDQLSQALWYTLWLTECLRALRPGRVVALFTDWRQLALTINALQSGGAIWRGVVVWDKTGSCRPQRGRFAAQAEYVVWGSKGQMPDGPCLRGVFSHYMKPAEKAHIAGKPIPLMEDLLAIAPKNGTVLDPFMGSGTVGLACQNLGLNYQGIELSQEYFDVAKTRLQRGGKGRLNIINP